MTQPLRDAQRATSTILETAVHRSSALSRDGLLERMFTYAFSGLVYPQIWEDPVVDMAALDIRPSDHVVAIASGSCNVLSYLTADPARITAVDLNGAHVALGRLKLAALRTLPDHAAFFHFFGRSDSKDNVRTFDSVIAPELDELSRAYWTARRVDGRRRIDQFADNFYTHGLLGRFIGAGHLLARLYGCDPRAVLAARTRDEQRTLFDRHFAPLFDKRFIRWLMRQPASLYGLGIPPAQFRALCGDQPDGMARVLRQRLERLACDFDISTNYFAWQAFGRSYQPAPDAALPPYLQEANYADVRERAERVTYRQQSVTDFLRSSPDGTVDCVVLLDAQDWMNSDELTELWSEITRAARPGARVIFRTAAEEDCLPGKVAQEVLGRWTRQDETSRRLSREDRSSIYGAFHLYTLPTAA
jgi:S-adenosylmethionine-diacylglycerol 3-amino-3-carboxypropyl transferase